MGKRHWLSQGTHFVPKGSGWVDADGQSFTPSSWYSRWLNGGGGGVSGEVRGQYRAEWIPRKGRGGWVTGVRQEQQASTIVPGIREGETNGKRGVGVGGNLFLSPLTVPFCVNPGLSRPRDSPVTN